MILRSRIHIVPDGDLAESSYDAAFEFSKNLASEWNKQGKPKFDRHSVMVLEKESHEYRQLREFFLNRVRNVAPSWVTWHELVEASYSKSELLKYSILELSITGQAGLGGNAYDNIYDVSVCQVCGLVTIHKQTRNLLIDLTKANTDFALTTNFDEILVSARAREVLQQVAPNEITFRNVEHVRPSRPPKRAYFQLIVNNAIEPLLAPSRKWSRRCPSCGRGFDGAEAGVETPDPWTEVHRWDPGPWSEMHFPKTAYKGWDIMRTAETFGGPIVPDDPRPESHNLLISRRLYQTLDIGKLTGFKVRPAHLD